MDVEANAAPQRRVAVLAVGLPEHDRQQLERIFQRTKWELRAMPTLAAAVAQLPVPVVLCEAYLADGGWRELLKQAGNWRNPPRVVVSSATADNALWGEVLNLGGYDVLARPFRADEALRVLAIAAHSWMDQDERERMSTLAAAR